MLVALCVGLGLLLEAIAGRRMPTALLPAAGFAALVAVGGLTTCFPELAELTTAVTVALAVAGYAAGWPLGGGSSPGGRSRPRWGSSSYSGLP